MHAGLHEHHILVLGCEHLHQLLTESLDEGKLFSKYDIKSDPHQNQMKISHALKPTSEVTHKQIAVSTFHKCTKDKNIFEASK